jgi:hypothetical protein
MGAFQDMSSNGRDAAAFEKSYQQKSFILYMHIPLGQRSTNKFQK